MATLLRSVARKMARAPPARPLLARGGAGGLGQGGSLPPPLTSSGIRSYLATTKQLAYAPSPHHHQLLHTSPNPAFSSPSPPPPTRGQRDLFVAKLAKVSAGLAYFAVIATTVHLFTVYLPEKKRWRTKLAALSMENSDLKDTIQATKLEALSRENSDLKDTIQAITAEIQHLNVQVQKMLDYASKVQSMLRSGHEMKDDGATKMETKVHSLDGEVAGS